MFTLTQCMNLKPNKDGCKTLREEEGGCRSYHVAGCVHQPDLLHHVDLLLCLGSQVNDDLVQQGLCLQLLVHFFQLKILPGNTCTNQHS